MACSTSGPVKKQVVVFHLDRLTLGTPLPPGHGQPPQLFTLLGVHADHRLAVGLVVLDLLVEVAELGIPVGVLGALEGLDVGLEAEPFPPQQSAHRRGGDPMALPGELLGQVPQRLGRPPQRRFRVTALVRLDQRQQGRDQVGVLPGSRLASPTWPADAAGREGSSPASNSNTPLRTVVSLTPATCATARTPPRPSSRASTANARRCWRSLRCGNNTSNLVAS
jgi:hypothetical protein